MIFSKKMIVPIYIDAYKLDLDALITIYFSGYILLSGQLHTQAVNFT